MKICSTSDRLKQIMEARNLRQIDILNLCKPFCEKYGVKLGRNDLSQYINNNVEPKQDKLTVLAKGLNVDEVWLMGYNTDSTGMYTFFDMAADVPIESRSAFIPTYKDKDKEAADLYKKFKKEFMEKYPNANSKEILMFQEYTNITSDEIEFLKKYRVISEEFKKIINQTLETGWNLYKKGE